MVFLLYVLYCGLTGAYNWALLGYSSASMNLISVSSLSAEAESAAGTINVSALSGGATVMSCTSGMGISALCEESGEVFSGSDGPITLFRLSIS